MCGHPGGPAAGVLAVAEVARRAGLPRVISFDMGGTTAKASLIEDSQVTFSSEFSVGSEEASDDNASLALFETLLDRISAAVKAGISAAAA